MLIVTVLVRVKPEVVPQFMEASLENAKQSRLEAGIARFDVLQQQDDPTRFMFLEVYRDPAAPAKHKETPHYARWRDTVAEMMAEPRSSTKYQNRFPDDSAW